MEPNGSNYELKRNGTIVLKIVEYSAVYSVTINGTTVTYETRDVLDTDSTDQRLNADEVLEGIKDAINAANLGVSVFVYPTSLELSDGQPFSLEVKGINNRALESFQDTVTNVSMLPVTSRDNRIVEVLNAGGDEDNYWLRYNEANKEWKETRDPRVSSGFWCLYFPSRTTIH